MALRIDATHATERILYSKLRSGARFSNKLRSVSHAANSFNVGAAFMQTASKSRRFSAFVGVSLLVVFGVTMRVLPHMPNVAPVGAIALLAGAVLGRRAGVVVPVSIMIISDLALGLYSSVVFTWLGFAAIGMYGSLFANQSFLRRVLLGAVGSGAIFYVVSNIGVWLASGMYAHTWAGLVQCFAMALPFYRASLLGDVVYTALIFGVYELAMYIVSVRRIMDRTNAPLHNL